MADNNYILKTLYANWRRCSPLFLDVHDQLEKELVRMRERKIPQAIIDERDWQIETLVRFYNQTEELMDSYRLELIKMRMENHFLTQMLAKKITIDELIQYKPSAHTIIKDMQTGFEEKLTELNG